MDPDEIIEQEGEQSPPSLEQELSGAIGLTEGEPEIDPDPNAAPTDGAAAEAAAVDAKPVAQDVVTPSKPAETKLAESELYAPLPEHNPRKTHERFAKLVEGHKTVSQERDAAVQERDQFRGQIERYETGLQSLRDMGFDTPESAADLEVFSQYRRALSSGNADAAIGILKEQARQLSIATGRRIEFNPLDQFQDLNQRHVAGELDEATAMELARARHVQQAQQQAAQRSMQAHQQEAQQAEFIHAAARSVDQVGLELQRDPDFKRIEPALMAALPDIRANYHPSQWAREVKRAYETEKRIAVLQAQQQPQRVQQPIRATGHTGGQPAPRSTGEAVLQALGFD